MKFIRPFVPDEKKLEFFYNKLMTEPLYISKEYRTSMTVQQMMLYWFFSSQSVFYEIGNFSGLLGFTNIVPGYKCGVVFKFWDKSIWGISLARELRDLSDEFMKYFRLKRLETDSPDEIMVKFSKIFGFKPEGTQRFGFMTDNNKLITTYLLRKIKGG